MKLRMALILVLAALVGARSALAAERSGTATLPAGSNLELLLASAQELLQHEGYKIDTADPQSGRLVGSLHLYHTQNVGGSGGILEEWRRWTLLFKRGPVGEVHVEISVASSHDAETPYEIAAELQNIVAGKGVSAAKSILTVDGVTKPLLEWKR